MTDFLQIPYVQTLFTYLMKPKQWDFLNNKASVEKHRVQKLQEEIAKSKNRLAKKNLDVKDHDSRGKWMLLVFKEKILVQEMKKQGWILKSGRQK